MRLLRHAPDDGALLDVIREGIRGTVMPGFVWALSDRSVRQTAAYVRSLGRMPPEHVPGDPTRGLTVYQKSDCVMCHTIRGIGGVTGPDLSAIGAVRGAAALRASLVDPGADHAPGYLVAAVTIGNASPVRGIVLDEDVFWIHLREAGGQVRTFQKTDTVRIDREPKTSLMPSYVSRLSDAELTDLAAYLSTLRGSR